MTQIRRRSNALYLHFSQRPGSVGGRPSEGGLPGRKAMEWFSRKTLIAGTQLSNWILVVAALVVIWIIYSFA
jgi:hypothetical protein